MPPNREIARYERRMIREVAENFLETRRGTITALLEFSEEAETIHKECFAGSRNANLTGALGGSFGVAAGITIFTGVLATPLLIASLTWAGGVCSVGGGGWAIKSELNRGQRMSKLKEKILKQIAEDNEAVRKVNEILNEIRNGDLGRSDRILRELHTVFAGAGCIGMNLGSTAAIDVLSQFVLLPVSYFLTPQTHEILSSIVKLLSFIAEKGAFKGTEEVAEQCASSAVKKISDGFTKNFARQEALKAARTAYKEVIEEAIEKAARKAAKEAAKKGGDLAAQKAAAKGAAKAAAEGAQQAARTAAKGAATTAVKEGMKTAAKLTGMVTAGFGAFTLLWEVRNAYRNHHASQEESPLGKELRDLANKMEVSLLSLVEENIN